MWAGWGLGGERKRWGVEVGRRIIQKRVDYLHHLYVVVVECLREAGKYIYIVYIERDLGDV